MNTVRAIISRALGDARPEAAVRKALLIDPPHPAGHLYLLAIGKAAWSMTKAAQDVVGDRLKKGIVITKYGHSEGEIPHCEIYEAGHPVPDENTLTSTTSALHMTDQMSADDHLIFLISGGGSSLFENSDLSLAELKSINKQLLGSGADISEINTIRKRLSNVKGGQFALRCAPTHITSIILSDVLGDRLESIASGPAYPVSETTGEAINIVEKYHLKLSHQARALLYKDMPQILDNVTSHIVGSVSGLMKSAAQVAEHHGFETVLLTDTADCEARELGRLLGAVARTHAGSDKKKAFLIGGETVVTLKGSGSGGRNQEIALAAAPYIEGLDNVVIFSFSSDGTDGPTDAAGGLVDGESLQQLRAKGFEPADVLSENNSYPALQAIDGLIMTGPTGTNVNDLSVILIVPR